MDKVQGKNIFSYFSDPGRKIPILSKNPGLEFLKLPNALANTTGKMKLFDRDLFDNEPSTSSFTTPPQKKSVTTPKIPVKNNIQFRKGGLKPKKLQFTENKLNDISAVDSGFSDRLSQRIDTVSHKQYTVESNEFDSSQKQARTLFSTIDKTNVQAFVIENDSSVPSNTLNAKNNVPQSAQSSLLDAPALSFYDNDNGDWKDILNWLQARRDVGMWIQCCRKWCKKWRYTEDYHDPVDVPKVWYCEMNSDKTFANCNVPEQSRPNDLEEDLIENAYNAGSIVWAHLRSYPWWPAIVADCPHTFKYYKLKKNSLRPVQYFVIFFSEDKLEYSWINKKDLKAFTSTTYNKLIKKTKFSGIDYKSSLDRAHEIASGAVPLSISERLQKFGYLAQYNQFVDDNNNSKESVDANLSSNTNSEDFIPATPPDNTVTLKEFYLKYICNR